MKNICYDSIRFFEMKSKWMNFVQRESFSPSDREKKQTKKTSASTQRSVFRSIFLALYVVKTEKKTEEMKKDDGKDSANANIVGNWWWWWQYWEDVRFTMTTTTIANENK